MRRCFVVLANHRLYTKSALVQISGRVGRAAERPTGELLFLHDGSTKEMRKAITEIKAMNKKEVLHDLPALRTRIFQKEQFLNLILMKKMTTACVWSVKNI